MHRNLIETLLGAVVLGVAGLFLLFAYDSADLGSGGGYEVHADFTTIGSLKVGSDVRLAGIKVGTVVGQELDQERSEEHTSELQSLMRISYAVFCLKKKNKQTIKTPQQITKK